MHEDVIACAELLERGDPPRFRAVMAAPVPVREVLFPLYAFNLEVARAPWVTQEPMIAEMRLQWWRDVLEEIRTGGPVRRHEVATPLAAVITPLQVPLLDALIEARRRDCHREPFTDPDALRSYLDATAGNLLVTAADILGGAPAAPVRAAGRAQGMANWLCALPALSDGGRVALKDTSPEVLRGLADRALRELSAARDLRDQIPRSAAPAMLCLWEVGPILRNAASDPERVLSGTLEPTPARSRFTLMMRAMSGRW